MKALSVATALVAGALLLLSAAIFAVSVRPAAAAVVPDPVPVRSFPQVAGAYGEVAVLHSAPTKVGGVLAGRGELRVWNCGPNELRCGSDPSPGASTGWPIPPKAGAVCGGPVVLQWGALPLWCLAGTADQVGGSGAATYWQETR